MSGPARAKHPCPKCGELESGVQHFNDDSVWCHGCDTTWGSYRKYEAEVIARSVAGTAKNWLTDDFPKELDKLMNMARLQVYEEIKQLAHDTSESQSKKLEYVRMSGIDLADNIESWADGRIADIKNKDDDE